MILSASHVEESFVAIERINLISVDAHNGMVSKAKLAFGSKAPRCGVILLLLGLLLLLLLNAVQILLRHLLHHEDVLAF